jgi:hypothetical protein
MQLSNQTKFLLLVAGVVVLIYFLNSGKGAIHNEGSLETPNDTKQTLAVVDETREDNTAVSMPEVPQSEQEMTMNKKFMSKNRSYGGAYKPASYAEGSRGNGPSDFDNYFDVNNDLVSGSQRDNDGFAEYDESEGKLAGYKGGKRRELTDEEIFKAEDYLPQEEAKDWFEVMPEPIQSKNRHLISVTRPVGINTIGTSLKNASYDIRGCPVNPKFVVSPKFSGCYVIIIIIVTTEK